jgi:hypothetical protein
MLTAFRFVGALSAALVIVGCSSAETSAPEHGAGEPVGEQAASLKGEQHYFSITRDMRRCIAPICGGYFIKAVNHDSTLCADGSSAARCYVASVDWSALGSEPAFDSSVVIVSGNLQSKNYAGFGEFGELVADGAWGSATAVPPTGKYYRLRDTGLRCITTPCFSIAAELLNSDSEPTTLSGLNLDAANASEKQLEAANAALAAGNLLVAGKVKPGASRARKGRDLNASQFFLPGSTEPRCYSDDDCQSGERCNAGEVCLPPPGCGPGRVCPAVCTGFCVPQEAGCKTSADCKETQYCASDKLCHEDATCNTAVDCTLEGNNYPRILCVGYAVCSADNQCGYRCGVPN